MRIAIAADHGGFALKAQMVEQLRAEGHVVLDLGTHSAERSDYPDFARAVGLALQEGRAERGILICGSGVGATVAANKMRGIRACVCHDTYSAHQGVEHDDMNVLVLGGRVIGIALAMEIARAFLGARFSNAEPYLSRLRKVQQMEDDLKH
ncbi:MAG: ribose 5-phosphate isomerase B [Thermoflexales bacterium]|nr:ribose 5-phosphate isomerase B [Thermoflexales bacterium]MCS7324770.1 ribose 5-phosphate isomerase B [Thermoflexales bacterium]MCX7939346.1 ribose 5-phosphate isomerase B [Thermoflexales bacterium]MDW8053094.1 ribose 5-phosphate isomerase B [Anaerolineae bacterium]MDW8291747.1 ribose 5-phosphate isomerase B [Anaerolineae bacterium]